MQIEVECEECRGKGWIELIGVCSLPASACCGGCTRDEECDECNGAGFNLIENEED